MSIGNEEDYTDGYDPTDDCKEAAYYVVVEKYTRQEAVEKVRHLKYERDEYQKANPWIDISEPFNSGDPQLDGYKIPPGKEAQVEAVAQELIRDGYGSEFE